MIVGISEEPLYSLPSSDFGWAEGIAYSSDGELLAVAELGRDRVSLLSEGRVVGAILGRHISAPHDVAFSAGDRLLAVANRGSAAVTLHERAGRFEYSSEPVRTLHRPHWIGTTAVSFEPESDRVVVVNHVDRDLVRLSGSVTSFDEEVQLWKLSGQDCAFSMPDGLAFSPDGQRLAVANNKSHEVTIYAREGGRFGRAPIARLGGLRHPHSLAFTPDSLELIVTNSGGPSVSVFRCREGEWSSRPVLDWAACPYETFLSAHYAAFVASDRTLACEGGPKGLALHTNRIAWSGPNIGIVEYGIDQKEGEMKADEI